MVEKKGFKWVNERPDAKSENDEKWGWIGEKPGAARERRLLVGCGLLEARLLLLSCCCPAAGRWFVRPACQLQGMLHSPVCCCMTRVVHLMVSVPLLPTPARRRLRGSGP